MPPESIVCPLCPLAPQRRVQDTRPYGLWECCGCGLMYSSPRPSAQEHRAFHDETYFRGYYGGSIEEFWRSQGPLFQRILGFNRVRLGIVRRAVTGGRLLDVGCGQGTFLEVARAAGFEAAGCDVSEYVARFHRARGLEVRTGALEEAGFAPRSFDAITFWQTLEHTLDPIRTLLCARELLRAGGLLVVSVPNMDSIVSRVKLAIGKKFLGPESTELHFFHWRPEVLERHLEACGYAIARREAEPTQERRFAVGVLERLGDALYDGCGWRVSSSVTICARVAESDSQRHEDTKNAKAP